MALPLLFLPSQQPAIAAPTPSRAIDVWNLVPLTQKDTSKEYDKDILTPLRAAQERAAKEAADRAVQETEAAKQAAEALVAQPAYTPPVQSYPQVTQTFTGDLIGSLGYALPYGNCVNEPGVNNPGYGNPADWMATSMAPWIGASALFYFNHVAVVTGWWPDGDVEVRHQNYQGGEHRFPRSMIRGYR